MKDKIEVDAGDSGAAKEPQEKARTQMETTNEYGDGAARDTVSRADDSTSRQTSDWSRATERARANERAKAGTATDAAVVGRDEGQGDTSTARLEPSIETKDHSNERLRGELRESQERFQRQWKRASDRARKEQTRDGHSPGERGARDGSDLSESRAVPSDSRQAEAEFREATERTRRVKVEQGDYAWVDRGVVDTKVSRIDRSEYADVWESQKTHKYSKKEIDASLQGLPEVRARLEKGATADELKSLASSQDSASRQVGRTYMTYYETDQIKVDFEADGGATVANGRHRLARADHLGIDDVPIRVSEQTRRDQEGEA